MIYIIIKIIMVGMFMGVDGKLVINDLNTIQNCKDSVTYEVKPGDNLYRIAQGFGHHSFWEYIYVANSSLVDNPHRIFPGQEIKIPARIASFKNSDLELDEILDNPYCPNEDISLSEVKEEYLISVKFEKLIQIDSLLSQPFNNFDRVLTLQDSSVSNAVNLDQSNDADESGKEDADLEEFRKAFNELIKSEKKKESSPDIDRSELVRYEIDGMVLDETISKIGRDFYNIFYQYWTGPENAYNYTVTISEKPAPSMGTIVMVKVNDTFTYQSRLQPRYELIEEAGKDAVRYSYSYLQRNKDGLTIY